MRYVIFAFTLILNFAAQAQDSGSVPARQFYASAQLTSNLVETGITQTKGSPAFVTAFGYKFGSGKIGVSGNNVKYEGSDAQLNLRLGADYKFQLSQGFDMNIENRLSRYFTDDNRNSFDFGLGFNFSTWSISFKFTNNYEGTKTERNYIALNNNWNLGGFWSLDTRFGYSLYKYLEVKNFYDFLFQVNYKWNELKLFLAVTYVSQTEVFNQASAIQYAAGISTQF